MQPDGAHGGNGALRYRPDIDGLRAVAVLPVVLYHLGFPALSGGFVGVDVFFVISGYLITSLLLADIRREDFSIVRFYERRIRRIFPALFSVIAASAVAAWFIFMPSEMAQFAKSAAAAALFGSNILFWDEAGYFDAEAHVKPLLHTWSLAVEEQFYIVFPLLLAALARIRIRTSTHVLASLWIASFTLSLWAQFSAPVFNFYWSPPRFWELLTGALLATGAVPLLAPARSRLLTLAGLALIAIAVFGYDEGTPFPGLTALLPCLGAAFVIHGGNSNGLGSRILTARPVVLAGLISYSLYLWHWPILVFVRYAAGDPTWLTKLAILAFSVLLASLSWRWIERPFRGKSAILTRRGIFAGAAASIAVPTGLGLWVNAYEGIPSRLPLEAQALYAARNDRSRFASTDCFPSSEDEPPPTDIIPGEFCRVGADSGAVPEFVVWGDSHASAMTPAIDKTAREHGRTGLLLGRGSCPPLLVFDTGSSKQQKIEKCMMHNAAVLRFIARSRVATVFLVARWPKYVHRSEYGDEGKLFDPKVRIVLDDHSSELAASLDRTLSALTEAGAKAVVVMDVPEIGYDVPHALAKASMAGNTLDIAPTREAVRQRQALALAVLTAAVRKHRAILVDPTPRFCSDEACWVKRGATVLYADEDHLSKSGAELIAPLFEPFFSAWPAR